MVRIHLGSPKNQRLRLIYWTLCFPALLIGKHMGSAVTQFPIALVPNPFKPGVKIGALRMMISAPLRRRAMCN